MWADQNERLRQADVSLHEARKPVMDLQVAEEAAHKRLLAARGRVGTYQDRVQNAAADVVRAEAPAIAVAMVERLKSALEVVLSTGPDLVWLVENGMVPNDATRELGDAYNLLNVAVTAWPAFDQLYRNSPYRGAVTALATDPDTALPSPPG